jgi:hypothetical protein
VRVIELPATRFSVLAVVGVSGVASSYAFTGPLPLPPAAAQAGLAAMTTIIAAASCTASFFLNTSSVLLPQRSRPCGRPAELNNAITLALGGEFPMNSWPTSENAVNAKFAEFPFHAPR